MKKYLISLSAVLLLVASCTKFKDEASQPVIVTDAPTITISAIGDSTFTATITSTEGTGFYSYAIQKGAKKSLDSATLFKVGYKSSSIVSATVSYEKAKTTTITLKASHGIVPNTQYQVYAVAASGQGTIGSVVNANLTTTDHLTPAPKTFTTTGASGSAAVTYNEPIFLSKAGAKAYATYYPVYKLSDSTTVEIPADSIKVSGTKLTITAPIISPGVYINITWEDNLVKNGVGTAGKGYMRRKFNKSDPSKSAGVTFRAPTESWDINYPMIKNDKDKLVRMPDDTVIYFVDPATFVAPWIADSAVCAIGKGANIRLTVTQSTGRVVSYDLEYDLTWKISKDTVVLASFAEAPAFGAIVDYEIAEGSLLDKFGNPNNAFIAEGNYGRSYGLTVADIVGTYAFSGNSGYDGPTTETGIVIKQHKKYKDSVEVFFMGITNPGAKQFELYYSTSWVVADSVVAFVDGVSGVLSMPTWLAPLATCVIGTSTYAFYLIEPSVNGDFVIFDFHEPGKFSIAANNMLGYYVVNETRGTGVGYADYYTSGAFTKTGPVPTATSVSVPFKSGYNFHSIKPSEKVPFKANR